MTITALTDQHYPEVCRIYRDGMTTGIATFETSVPDWKFWDEKFLKKCRYVATIRDEVVAWCALSAVSNRVAYSGVAEVTIYVSAEYRGQGIGSKLLEYLTEASEEAGFWTLYAAMFPRNKASIRMHHKSGFRIVGRRERIAERDGVWHDNIIMERRSKKVNFMKNILVLCTGNSCRSQMAHGYLEKMAADKASVYSAGIETHGLNPGAVAIMKEDNVDISDHTSNHVDEYEGIAWDYIITVCDHANENCPFIPAPNAVRLHQNFTDPSKVVGTAAEKHKAFEKTREEIKEYCRKFIATNL